MNVDAEASKSGISPEELPALAAAVSKLPRLRLRGLMSIPAPAETYEGKMKPLLAMASLFKAFQEKYPQADTLSMGMSADLTEAVEAGSHGAHRQCHLRSAQLFRLIKKAMTREADHLL